MKKKLSRMDEAVLSSFFPGGWRKKETRLWKELNQTVVIRGLWTGCHVPDTMECPFNLCEGFNR
jgi:hypothetical protein